MLKEDAGLADSEAGKALAAISRSSMQEVH